MGSGATELTRHRIVTPRNDYPATIASIVDLISRLMHGSQSGAKVGIAVPGSISPLTGLMQNANSTWLNGRPFDRDLEVALAMPVRLANDANCFALSEAMKLFHDEENRTPSCWLALWLMPVIGLLILFGAQNVFSQIAAFFSKHIRR